MKSYELIKQRLKDLKIKKRKLVEEGLGYRNLNKGHRKLDAILKGGVIELKHVSIISKVLQIKEEKLLESMIATEEEIQSKYEIKERERITKERKEFVPYFYCINEKSIPSPIFIGVMTHNLRFVYYTKDFMQMPIEKQLLQVKFDIVEHFTKNKGEILAFQKILYYTYKYSYDLEEQDLILLSTTGEIITDKEGMRTNEGKPSGIWVKKPKNRIDQLFKLKSEIIDNRN